MQQEKRCKKEHEEGSEDMIIKLIRVDEGETGRK